MPFIKEQVPDQLTLDVQPPLPDVEQPTFLETAQASVALDNTLGNVLNWLEDTTLPINLPDNYKYKNIDKSYNAIDQEDWSQYKDRPEQMLYLFDATSKEDYQRRLTRLQKEDEYRDVIARSSTGQTLAAGLVAGVLDPTNFIGAPIRGGNIAWEGVKFGMKQAGIQAGSEVLAHQVQPGRTLEESILNTAGVAAVAGFLGAGSAALTKKQALRLADDLKRVEADLERAKALGDANDAALAGKYGPDADKASAVDDLSLQAKRSVEAKTAEAEQLKASAPGAQTLGPRDDITEEPSPLAKLAADDAGAERAIEWTRTADEYIGTAKKAVDDLRSLSPEDFRTRIGDVLDLIRTFIPERVWGTELALTGKIRNSLDVVPPEVVEELKQLGMRVTKEYGQQGLRIPKNASKETRGAINAWISENVKAVGLDDIDNAVAQAKSALDSGGTLTDSLKKAIDDEVEMYGGKEAEEILAAIRTHRGETSAPEQPQQLPEDHASLVSSGATGPGVGANAVVRPDNTLVGGKVLQAIREGRIWRIGIPKALQPLALRVASASSEVARGLGERLFSDAFIRVKNLAGEASRSISTRIDRLKDVHERQIYRVARDTYKAYALDMKNSGQKAMSKSEFSAEVAFALRRGDDHSNVHVKHAAQRLRAEIYDPTWKEASALLGLNTNDLFAKSYFTRHYNIEKLTIDKDGFVNTIATYFRQQNTNLTAQEAADAANDVWHKIVFQDDGFAFRIDSPANPFHKRTLAVPDEIIEPFLTSDAFNSAAKYTNRIVRYTEFTREFGDVNLVDDMIDMDTSYADLIAKAPTDEAKARLQVERNEMRDLILAMRDNILNWDTPVANTTTKILQRIREYNVITKMGGVVLSSVADLARPMMGYGLKRYVPFVTRMLLDSDFRHMNRQMVEAAGVGFEHELMSMSRRFDQMTDLDRIWGNSKIDVAMKHVMNVFSKLTLMPYWNNIGKRLGAGMSVSRFVDTALDLSKGIRNQDDITFCAHMGLDENDLAALAQHFTATHSDRLNDSMKILNPELIQNLSLRNRLLDGMKKAADIIIVTPNAASLPRFMNDPKYGPWAKTIFQFKSFSIASHTQTLVYGLQFQQANFLQGLIAAVGLGAFATYAKDIIAGRDPLAKPADLKSAMDWTITSIDRAGVLTIPLEMNNILNSASGGTMSLQSIWRGVPPRRYMNVGKWGAILGPSAGLGEDAMRVLTAGGHMLRDTLDGKPPKMSSGDIYAARRLVPFNNLFYIQGIFNEVENAVNKGFSNKFKEKRGIPIFSGD